MIQKARYLSLFTIIYNIIEGLVSVYFGLEEGSISLLGFGLDSFVEVASAVIVLLKLRSCDPDQNLSQERKATFGIGILFLILAMTVLVTSVHRLVNHSGPDTTIPGLIISVLSLSFMFFLWRSKLKVAVGLNSATVKADAQCSLACMKLSLVLFTGSLLFLLSPALWWIDSVAALVIGIQIGREGKELITSSRKKDFTGGCGCHQ